MLFRSFLLVPAAFIFLTGCAMFAAWKTIPPPGGCDQCHTVPIGHNWKVVYEAPSLTDERDKLAFQTDRASMPQPSQPASSLDLRKVEEQPCFECHRAPNSQHRERKGRFHH